MSDWVATPSFVAGEVAEAQEPLAALPGPNEEEALASASGPEREQAMSLPRDATADVWLREGARTAAAAAAAGAAQRMPGRWPACRACLPQLALRSTCAALG